MTEIKEVYSICQELMNISSTLGKQAILEREKDNELFKKTLKFLLDPMIVTGINKKKINKGVNIGFYETENGDYWLEDLLEYLSTNNTGRDVDIAHCQFYISKITDDEELQNFIKSIITKSLKLGIDVKTANKVYGKDFISVLNVMLGMSIEKCKIPQGAWFSISQKLNGSRCFYYKGQLYTRQGKVYTGCEHIINDLNKLEEFYRDEVHSKPFMYDGELILKDDTLSDSDRFQKGVGIANSDSKEKTELKLVIFDTMPVEEFENGVSTKTYKDRKHTLEIYKKDIKFLGLKNIEIVPMFYEGTDQSEIWKWLDYAEKNDMEGVMVNLDTPYECRRVKTLIKIKKFFDTDLRCLRIEEGDGKYKNTLGAIVCAYKGCEVKIGSGFTDEQRNYYWNNSDEIINKIITVKYKEETKNKNGGVSLQFPVFQCVRFDKDMEDG